MGEDDDRLRDLVEHAIGASTPEAGLRAVGALRPQVDALERRHARRALEAGLSFGAIARALGISRQAAHRRYRHVAEEAAPVPDGAGAGGRILVTSEARAVVARARAEARDLGATTVGTEHLLLGIVGEGHGAAAEALSRLGVTLDAARGCAQPTLVDGTPAGAEPGSVEPGPRGISPFARKVFEQSLREALARGDGYIGTDHLLLAALRDAHGGAARTLEALGVPPSAVSAQLAG
jgi:hypothetical protein